MKKTLNNISHKAKNTFEVTKELVTEVKDNAKNISAKTAGLIALGGFTASCTPDNPVDPTPVVPIVTTQYEANTNITPNNIDENQTGKIGIVNTVVEKITLVDGVETNRETVTNPNVTYTDLNEGQTMVGNEIHLEEGYEVDHENPDGSDKTNPTIASFVKAMVNMNGQTAIAFDNKESGVNDIDDFAPYPNLNIEINGQIPAEYTSVVENYTDLIGNNTYSIDTQIIQALANAAGDDFGVETVQTSANFSVPFLTYNGQKISAKSISWLIDAAKDSRLSGQSSNMEEAIETGGLAEYLKKGLQNFNYVANTNGDNQWADIMFTQLEAAKAGAGARVNQNIDNGNY